jgi:DNA polymerase III alpha subunit (gram-positive type)
MALPIVFPALPALPAPPLAVVASPHLQPAPPVAVGEINNVVISNWIRYKRVTDAESTDAEKHALDTYVEGLRTLLGELYRCYASMRVRLVLIQCCSLFMTVMGAIRNDTQILSDALQQMQRTQAQMQQTQAQMQQTQAQMQQTQAQMQQTQAQMQQTQAQMQQQQVQMQAQLAAVVLGQQQLLQAFNANPPGGVIPDEFRRSTNFYACTVVSDVAHKMP